MNLILQKKILFIVNPISGVKNKDGVRKQMQDFLDLKKFLPEIAFTERPNHASELTKLAVQQNFDAVIAVGGDGTVNEVARTLAFSNTALGIIPFGSGNGIARHLNIPLLVEPAIGTINKFNTKWIDTGSINKQLFVGFAGIGFDAHISWQFAQSKKRGLSQYVKLSVKEYFNYKPEKISIKIDEQNFIETEAFLVTFANTNQYGNNAFIAPNAKEDDGMLEVVILKKLPLVKAAKFAYDLFNKKADNNQLTQTFKGKKIRLLHNSKILHIDGEPLELSKNLEISIVPYSLKVIHNLV